jgi:hypothetical protein
MPIGIRKTQAERLIVAHCAMHGETLEYCNARLREGDFTEIPASSYKTWTRSNTGYVSKLDTKEKIKQHIRSPFPHGSC